MSTVSELTPADLGMTAIDLTDVASNDSAIKDGRDVFAFQVHTSITAVSGSPSATGLLTVSVLLYANDKTTLLDTIVLASDISTKTTGGKSRIVFGGGVTASVASESTYSGTIGPDADKVKVIGWYKIRAGITELTDAAGTMTVRVLAERS